MVERMEPGYRLEEEQSQVVRHGGSDNCKNSGGRTETTLIPRAQREEQEDAEKLRLETETIP